MHVLTYSVTLLLYYIFCTVFCTAVFAHRQTIEVPKSLRHQIVFVRPTSTVVTIVFQIFFSMNLIIIIITGANRLKGKK